MITGFYHTGFVVSDLDAMISFYQDVLGLSLKPRGDLTGQLASQISGYPEAHVRVAFLGKEGDSHQVELVQYISPPGCDRHASKNDAGATHLCFLVDDLDAAYGKLSDRGVNFESPPVHLFRLKACLARDPEGNWLEFVELLNQRG